jgi:hypothetical protein
VTQDYEMGFAIPWSKIGEIIEGLEGTHKGGIRYPIPSFLSYTGEFPTQYAKVSEQEGKGFRISLDKLSRFG